MNLLKALESELFKPLATIFVPGTIAISPYYLLAVMDVPILSTAVESHTGIITLLATVGVLAIGLILEDIGSRIECHWHDGLAKKDSWDSYLQLRIQDEFVGQRYIQTLLPRMKFELSMVPALSICVIGLLLIQIRMAVLGWLTTGIVAGTMLVVAVYLLLESKQSVRLLAEKRELVLNAATSGGTDIADLGT